MAAVASLFGSRIQDSGVLIAVLLLARGGERKVASTQGPQLSSASVSAHPPPPRPTSRPLSLRARLRAAREALRQVPGTFELVWRADRGGALRLAALTTASALLPAGIAWTGKLIVDAVVAASRGLGAPGQVTALVGLELLLMALSMVTSRLSGLERELLRARLGNAVNEHILEKALELELRHFEDATVYDKMQNARREASSRPLSLVLQAFGMAQNAVTLAALSALLVRLSALSLLVVVASSVPAFVAEARMAAASFRLNSWRAPEGRRLNYLEWILTRDSHVKEVKLFGLGPLVLERYRTLFSRFYEEDRQIAVKRMALGVVLGAVALGGLYAMYALVAHRAARGEVTLGDLTLYLAVFRQDRRPCRPSSVPSPDCTRMPSTCRTSSTTSPSRPAARHRASRRRGRRPADARAVSSSKGSFSDTPARIASRCATSPSSSSPARSSAWSARMEPARARS